MNIYVSILKNNKNILFLIEKILFIIQLINIKLLPFYIFHKTYFTILILFYFSILLFLPKEIINDLIKFVYLIMLKIILFSFAETFSDVINIILKNFKITKSTINILNFKQISSFDLKSLLILNLYLYIINYIFFNYLLILINTISNYLKKNLYQKKNN